MTDADKIEILKIAQSQALAGRQIETAEVARIFQEFYTLVSNADAQPSRGKGTKVDKAAPKEGIFE